MGKRLTAVVGKWIKDLEAAAVTEQELQRFTQRFAKLMLDRKKARPKRRVKAKRKRT